MLHTVNRTPSLQMPRRSGNHTAVTRCGSAGARERRHPSFGQVKPDFEIGLHRGGDAGQLVRAPSRERPCPIHPPTQKSTAEQKRSGGATGHAPLVESRCDEDLFVAGQYRADIG
jgi:hypothetical protein